MSPSGDSSTPTPSDPVEHQLRRELADLRRDLAAREAEVEVLRAESKPTDRQRAEEAQRLREAHLSAILENPPGLVWFKDSESRYLAANRAMMRALGVENPADVLGKTDLDFVPALPRMLAEKYRADDARVMSSGLPAVIEEQVFTRGEPRWFETFKTPVVDAAGRVIGTTGFARDITEQRRMEQALRESEAKFRQMVEASPLPIGIATLDGRIEYVNPKFVEVFGYRQEEIPQLADWFLRVYPDPEYRRQVSRRWEQDNRWTTPENRPTEPIEVEITCKDGTVRTIQVVSTTVEHRVLTIFSDLTERKRTEQALRRQVSEIERFNRLATARELRVIALKRHINELSEAAGRRPPFRLPADELAPERPVDAAAAPGAPETSSSSVQDYRLEDLLDRDRMRHLFESYSDTVGISSAIVDPAGVVLVSGRWQRICGDFHRVDERTRARCVESDVVLGNRLREGESFTIYQCRNGLVDAASPIIVEGRHLGNVFIGQFFLEPADQDFFRRQAAEFGFEEASYLEALARVPVVPREKLPAMLRYLTTCAQVVAEMGLERIRGKAMAAGLVRQAEERDRVNLELRRQREAALSLAEDANQARLGAERAEQLLRESEQKLRTILEVSPLPISWSDAQGRIEYWNRKARELFGYAPEEIATVEQWFLHAHPDPAYRQTALRHWHETLASSREGAAVHGEKYDVTCRDGTVRTLEIFVAGFGDERHMVIFNDVTARQRAEEALRASLDEKIALLKEVHHRVKNNLQIVSSLLSLQAAQVQNPLVVGALQDTQNRVRSMALIHETLYRSENLARVNFPVYVENLCAHLFGAFGVDPARVQLISRVAGVALELDEAVPCGLIINELVSNALKHAFPAGRAGQITLELLAEADGQRTLRVADNGVGLPAGLDPGQIETLGLKLVINLADQLNGTLAWERTGGTTFRLRFRESLQPGDI